MNNDDLRKLAAEATPIATDLCGDRYFQGAYSIAELTKAQDDFIAAANPAKIIELLDTIEQQRKLLKQALVSMQSVVHFRTTGVGRPPEQTCLREIEAILNHLRQQEGEKK